MLQTTTEELEATRKKLALVREEGFQFMASLDVIRNELKHVTVETDRLKKKKGKVDSTVQNLNFKILRAKSKLEPVSAAEEKARSIVMSLSHTLEKLENNISMIYYLGLSFNNQGSSKTILSCMTSSMT